ncbi:MAG TPA: type II 3-dehydroquinate dehydratase [Myxococcaceae bacterium]|jgi:3-dehydroquinate dehydratase-2
MNVLVLHGPTLQFLGQRAGDSPGLTLADVDRRLAEKARSLGHVLRTLQSNHEGALVDALWEQRAWAEGVVLNPGPLAPGSHVLRAAVSASRMPVVEVLLAPAKGRAAMQRRSLLREVCAAHVAGTGAEAYLEALERLSRAASKATAARTAKTIGRAPGRPTADASRAAASPTAPAGAARTTGKTPVPAAAPATKATKSLGPARAETAPGRSAEPATARAPAAAAVEPAPAGAGKTLGRAAPHPAAGTRRPGAGLTRAEVRARIADRLASRITAAGLATWARGEWVALQGGAAAEAGQRDQLEEVLQALFLAVQPKGALSDHQLVEWMAALE